MSSLLCWLWVISPDSHSIPKKIITKELVSQKYLHDGHNQVGCFTGKESCSISIVLVVEMLLGKVECKSGSSWVQTLLLLEMSWSDFPFSQPDLLQSFPLLLWQETSWVLPPTSATRIVEHKISLLEVLERCWRTGSSCCTELHHHAPSWHKIL